MTRKKSEKKTFNKVRVFLKNANNNRGLNKNSKNI